MVQYTEDLINYSRFRDLPGAVYTRSGQAYQQNASGLLVPFDENVPPISDGVGLGVWEARTQSFPAPIFTYPLPGDQVGVTPTGYISVGVGSAFLTTLAQESVLGVACRPLAIRRANPSSGYEGFGASPNLALPVGTHVVSIYLRRPAGVQAADVLIYTGAGSPTVALLASAAQINAQPVGEWVRRSAVITMTVAGIASFVTQPAGGLAGVGCDFAFPQAYLNTSVDIGDPPILQTNNAAATRGAASAYLNAPGLIIPALGVTVVAEVEWPRYTNASGVFVEPSAPGLAYGFTISTDSAGTKPRLIVRQGSARKDSVSSGPSIAPGEVVRMAVTFTDAESYISAKGQTVANIATPSQADYSGQGVYVGSRAGNSNFANTNIRKVQILQGLRTQAELNAITA